MIWICSFQRLKVLIKGGVTASPFSGKTVQTPVTLHKTDNYGEKIPSYMLSHSTK